mmetsp:Transcript_52182/g.77921  ORF Transcript_52182/g.77921 Transcript_52182/m.77921 type:complete len:437 (-) Transcript_52182:60-1370(-)
MEIPEDAVHRGSRRLPFDDGMDGPTLREVVSNGCKRIDVGCAVLPKHLSVAEPDVDDPAAPTTTYAKIVKNEFNAIVVEHHLKWGPLCHDLPGPFGEGKPSDRVGRYDFSYADSIVDWALQKDLKVKGHVLCWHVTTPKWVDDTLTSEEVREQLRRHIFTTVGHYRGRIHVWDVVNESLAPDGSLADNVFLRKLGPEYIQMCFQWANECDPSATLLYNDNKVEGLGGPNGPKSEAFYNLLADLKSKNVPVHGCGIQAHFNAAGVGRNRIPTPRMIKQQVRRLGELGLKVNISEFDVRVSQLPANLRQIAQRQVYRDVVAACLTEPCFDGIWLWGFTDRHTWVTHFYYDDEPLVYDEEYGRKESYYGLREALETMTAGGTVGGNVPLDSDVDEDGNPWGYLWMQPEETVAAEVESNVGDSRPDWLQTKATEEPHELT